MTRSNPRLKQTDVLEKCPKKRKILCICRTIEPEIETSGEKVMQRSPRGLHFDGGDGGDSLTVPYLTERIPCLGAWHIDNRERSKSLE